MKKIIVFFLLLNIFSFSASDIDKLKNKTKTIDSSIKKNQENINVAKKKESETVKQIKKIEEDLKVLKENYYEIEEQLQKAKLNLQYTESNVVIVNQEIQSSNHYFSDTISKYNDYLFTSKDSFFLEGYSMDRYFEIENMKALFGDVVETLDNINDVKKDVDATRVKISNEKAKVEKLKMDLENKRKAIESAKAEKDRLVAQLKKDQVTFGKEISKLKKEKAAIEKQIANIIKSKIKPIPKDKVVSNSEITKQIGYMSMPLDGTVKYNFGSQKEAGVYAGAMEIKGKLGQKVTAANAGEVIFAGSIANLGNVIIINHGYNLISTYGNLISLQAGVGAKVKKGQQIGVLGLSSDREPVLYFETRISSKSVDPRIFLK